MKSGRIVCSALQAGLVMSILCAARVDAQPARRILLADLVVPAAVLAPSTLKDISDSDADETTIFTSIVASARLADGSVLVADGRTRELRHFDNEGRFVKLWARRGRGPGELESISWVQVTAGDSVFVYDRAQRRISHFAGGRFLRQWTLADLASLPGPLDAIGVTSNRRFVLRRLLSDPNALGTIRGREELFFATSGQSPSSILEYDGDEIFVRASSSGGRIPGTPAFQRRSVVAVGSEHIAIGDTESGRLRIVGVSSPQTQLVDVIYDNPRLREEDIKARLDKLWGARPPNNREVWERLQREMISTRTIPVFSALHFDEKDNLWLLRYDRTQLNPQSWIVMSTDGSAIHTATLPMGCEAQHIRSNQITCARKDDDGRTSISTFTVKR